MRTGVPSAATIWRPRVDSGPGGSIDGLPLSAVVTVEDLGAEQPPSAASAAATTSAGVWMRGMKASYRHALASTKPNRHTQTTHHGGAASVWARTQRATD